VTRRRLVTALLVLGIVLLFAVPLALNAGRSDYTGTDNQATAVIEQNDPHYRPWFSSVFTPTSPSVESGLFALQAALGGAVLGYALGRLRGRRLAEEKAEKTTDAET
jgi:cobalt/nickel transport protein